MRVLFIAKLIQDRMFTPYSLYVLSARVRCAGHETDIVDAINIQEVKNGIRRYQPDVLAFSALTARWPFFRKTIETITPKHNLPTIIGGIHATFRPEIVLTPGVSAVCVGEGESTLVDFLARLESGQAFTEVPNLAVKDPEAECGYRVNPLRPLIRDFARLPLPHFALTDSYYYCRQMPIRTMVFSRGCKYSCAYCSNSGYRRLYRADLPFYRQYSLDRMFAELEYVKQHYPCRYFHFFDDIFAADDAFALAFAERYQKQIGIPFYCHLVAGTVTETGIMALKKAGLHCVGVSLETGDERQLNCLLKRPYQVEQFVDFIGLLNRAGINSYVGNILALPDSTLADDLKTLEVNRRARVSLADSSLFIPLPGTTLGEAARERGLFDAAAFDHSYHSTDPTIHRQVMLNVPHARQAKRLHCLFDMANDVDWVARYIRLLVRLPLFWPYLFLYKIHSSLKKRRFLFRSVMLPLKLKFKIIYHTFFS